MKAMPNQEEMNSIAAEFEAACLADGSAIVGAAEHILIYLRRGDFVMAKYKAKLDRDKFTPWSDKHALAVLEKYFGCMLHGVIGCPECRR